MAYNICVMKMITGEEVIADVSNVSAGMFIFKKPRAVHLVPTQNGAAMHLVPWLNVIPDAEAPVAADDVVTILQAPAEVEQAYLRSTSGLDLSPATGGSIIHS